jgi:aspartate racemase
MSQTSIATPVVYRTIGVLGGMGALATVDFLHKLVLATPANCDQDHISLLVRFCPEVPDRVDALLGRGPSPEPALVAAALGLERGGAQCLVMPCNTAHAWHDAIAHALSIPILHIADAALKAACLLGKPDAVGLLATTGTLHSEIYQSRSGNDVGWITSSNDEQDQWVMPGIRAVKANHLEDGTRLLQLAAEALIRRGARSIIMGCTEIPIALAHKELGVPLVDPTLALAHVSVAWADTTAMTAPVAATEACLA